MAAILDLHLDLTKREDGNGSLWEEKQMHQFMMQQGRLVLTKELNQECGLSNKGTCVMLYHGRHLGYDT